MRNQGAIILFAIFVLFVISCNTGNSPNASTHPAGFDKERAKSFIDSINLKFSEQFKAGDSVTLASHYWPDAEMLFANMEPIKGDSIMAAWGSMTHYGISDFTFSTTNISGNNEFIIETGEYQIKDAKQSLIDSGKYVVVWQNRNGEWKIFRDIGNTSLPAAK